ncbi:MAG: baseplate J/gp47 family protein, partial [Casimicrobium sp.]
MTTSVPAPTLSPTGFVAPRESEILAGVMADLNAAFGGNLNEAQDTPQGQLAVSLAAIIGFNNDRLLQLINQFDPAIADGRAQDALGRIYFIDRTPAEATTVAADCGGAAGTTIPIGSLARTADGTVYAATTGGTIPTSGVLTLQFAATVTGPTPCPAGSLNTIFRAVPGWDTVTNPQAGILGRNVESRAEFEARRAASVAANSIGALGSIRASVLSVPDVLDAFVTENATASPVTVRGVSIAARSLFV